MRASVSSEFALEVEKVTFQYGKYVALNNVSFNLRKGKFAVLLGLNGAGKTTLFSLTTRLFKTQGGSVRIFGNGVHNNSTAALQNLGVVFQQRTLDMDLTVQQNLMYFAALHGMSRTLSKERMQIELERIGLAEKIHEKVRTLSGGQLRRVEIARSLMHQPALLVLDEATVGLDMGSREEILTYMRQLCDEQQISLLWATHLIDEVSDTDQVLVLHRGQLIADSMAAELVSQSETSDIRRAFQYLIDRADSKSDGI